MDSAAASLTATTQPPPSLQSETLDHVGDAANAAAGAKKPAWIVPSNGSSSSVMGASWPALSESARSSPKSADGSAPAPPGPVVAQSAGDPNPNSTPAPAPAPTRQNSMKRAAGAGGGSPTLPNGGHVLSSPESSPKALPNNGNNPENGGRGGGSSPQPHGPNDHHRGYGGSRRGNGVGGGPRNVSYGNRRDQEHEWNHRNFSSRDVHMQPPPPRGVRPFLRPPGPVVAPFIAPHQPVRPAGNQMMYPDMHSPVYYMAAPAPFIAHPPPPAMFFPPVDPQRAILLQQIEYYFSPQNLCRDLFLRRNMDDHGWVSIHLIAGFNRVKHITSDIQYILDTVRSSSIVEAQGEKIRKRNDWMNWVLPPAPQSPVTPSSDNLAARLQTVVLDEGNSRN